MALNPYVNEFVYKACAAAIQRDGDDAAKLLATTENVVLLREQGALTDAQVGSLSQMVGIEIEVPDAPDTWDARMGAIDDAIAGINELVSEHDDAIAELGEVVSEIIGGE